MKASTNQSLALLLFFNEALRFSKHPHQYFFNNRGYALPHTFIFLIF